MKTIITDVDGVLLNWGDGFDYWLQHTKHIACTHSHTPNTYGMGDKYDLSDGQILELIDEFNGTPYFGELSPIRDAADIIPWLVNSDDYAVGWLSCGAPTKNPMLAYNRRNANIRAVFGVGITGELLGLRCSKIDSLKQYDPNTSVFVEDSLSHALDGANLGFETFLMDFPYNQSSTPLPLLIHRVQSWSEIEEALHAVN